MKNGFKKWIQKMGSKNHHEKSPQKCTQKMHPKL